MSERRHNNERDVFFVRRYDDRWCVEGVVGELYSPFVCDTEDEALRWRDRLHATWYAGVVEGRNRQARDVLHALGVGVNGGNRIADAGEVTVRIDRP